MSTAQRRTATKSRRTAATKTEDVVQADAVATIEFPDGADEPGNAGKTSSARSDRGRFADFSQSYSSARGKSCTRA